MDVDTGSDDVHANTLITSRVVVVESESSEAKVGGTGKTLREVSLLTMRQERDSGTSGTSLIR